jgi:PAS domain S-box-containing protein
LRQDDPRSSEALDARRDELVRALREAERAPAEFTGGEAGAVSRPWVLAQQLEVERARLAAAQRVAKVGSWENELATNQVTWSEETHRIFETDPRSFAPTHQSFLQLVHPEDRAMVDGRLQASIEEGGTGVVEHRIVMPDGRVKLIEERWQVVKDERGTPVKALGTCQDLSERARADDELRKSQALLRMAGKVARMGGWMLQLPERKLTWSDEVCEIHDRPSGYTPTLEEGLAMFAPEGREEIARHMAECERDGASYDLELQKVTAKGRRIWVRSIGEAVRDAQGKIVRLQGAFQDITSRKRAEQELARINRALRLLGSCNRALVREQDEAALLEQTCRIAVEDGGYQLAWVGYAMADEARTIGIRASAGRGAAYLDAFPVTWSPDEPAGRGPAGRTIREGRLVVCSDIESDPGFAIWREPAVRHGIKSALCFPLLDGERTFGVLALYASEVSQAGADELKLLQELADNLALGVVNLRNREERRQAETKIIEQAALLDQARDAIFVRDLDHRISYWNRGAERLYGWSADEAVGKLVTEFLHGPAEVGSLQRALDRVLAAGEWAGELHTLGKNGKVLLVESRWTLLRDAHGRPRAVLTIHSDISEKKQLEAQFLRIQRMESIGTLAGGIAHDLNNVLTPILASVAMLRDEEQDAEKLEDLSLLQISAERGASMVRQLLTFARGEKLGPRKPVNVLAVAQEVMKLVAETFPKDITPTVVAPGKVWRVQGDSTQIQQLLTNLCLNARDAMPGGGLLKIVLEELQVDEGYAGMNVGAKPGPYLLIQVEDTGAGMPPEVQERIFEPFFTTKDLGKGTGLGLWTCHAIVQGHGGFIRLHSEPGKGTQFRVYLPADITADEQAPRPPASMPRGNGELVLVVDDEESIRKVARRVLERYGYSVLTASNGAEAVALYKERGAAIAAVLTDMSMPVMDGPQTILALQAINPAVRIIGSSGFAADGKLERARSAGVTHFVPKPYTAQTLLEVLRRVI